MKTIRRVLTKTFEICIKSGIGSASAELSFYMIFMIFPLVLTATSILEKIGFEFENTLLFYSLVPEEVAKLFEDFSFVNQAGGIMGHGTWPTEKGGVFIGAFLCLWSGTKYIISAGKRLSQLANNAGVAQKNEPKQLLNAFAYISEFLKQRLVAATYFFVTVTAGVITVILSLLGQRFYELLPPGHSPLWELLGRMRFIFVFAVAWTALTGIYRSCREFPQMCGIAGKTVASLMWMVTSAAFAYYVENISNYSLVYGSAATVTVLLLWLYLTNAIILFGATVNLAVAGGSRALPYNSNVKE